MLRFIIKQTDTAHVVHGGASKAKETIITLDCEVPELEKILHEDNTSVYNYQEVIGVEVLSDTKLSNSAML